MLRRGSDEEVEPRSSWRCAPLLVEKPRKPFIRRPPQKQLFAHYEAADTTIKEVGFFGGNVAYVEGVTGPVAENGIYDEVGNPDGEVFVPGYLYEVRNIPDFSKGANTMLELVAVVKL
ncbi:MAG: hypothetical protein FJ290_10210 [Planctomycetes bacterium]|nr:hypothetical protein [Planctomycetota bacterium]